jgi:hypothetical protein
MEVPISKPCSGFLALSFDLDVSQYSGTIIDRSTDCARAADAGQRLRPSKAFRSEQKRYAKGQNN